MQTIHAPAPKKVTATFKISFGLVSVPVELYAPVETSNPIDRHLYTPEGNSAGMRYYDKVTGKEVAKGELRLMVEVDGKLVELTDDEMADATAPEDVDRGDVPVEAFIPLTAIHSRYVVEKSYQARPAHREISNKKAPDPQAIKAFATFIAALQAEKVAALFKVGLRKAARYAVLTPDGTVHFVHFDAEVRDQLPIPEADVNPAEVKFSRELIQAIGVGETPELVDTAGELLLAYVEAKAKNTIGVTPTGEAPVAEVLDITAALQASLAAAKAKKATAKKAAPKTPVKKAS